MKHIFVYLIAAALIFSYINFFVSPGEKQEQTFFPAQLTLAATTPAAEPAAPTVTIKAGVIFENLDSLDAVYCKNALAESLGVGYDLRATEAAGAAPLQKEIFDKMVEKGYQLIFVDLFEGSDAAYFAETAEANGITLVFLGDAPGADVMAYAENLYYIGFGEKPAEVALGEAVARMWMSDRESLDFDEDEVLEYSVLSREGFQESGRREQWENYFSGIGLPCGSVLDFLTDDVSVDVEEAIDQMIIDDSELFICVESSNATKLVNYLNDPTEFNSWPNLQIAVLSVDEDARKLVNDGYVAFAAGYDGAELGRKAAQLAQALLAGETPDAQSMGVTLDENRCFYLEPTVLRAAQLTAQAAELD